jgi:hypothetical protein
MMRTRLLPLTGLAVLCLSPVLFAHHSISAGYFVDRTIQLTGVVTEVDWSNPHVGYFVDVADSSGAIRNWNVEALAPHLMIKGGIERAAVKIGDRVTFTGYAAKNFPFVKQAMAMTRMALPGGKTVEIDPLHWTMQPPPPAPK